MFYQCADKLSIVFLTFNLNSSQQICLFKFAWTRERRQNLLFYFHLYPFTLLPSYSGSPLISFWMFYHFLSPGASSGSRTLSLDLRMTRQVFYHRAGHRWPQKGISFEKSRVYLYCKPRVTVYWQIFGQF